MEITLKDRSNYLKGLLILIGKDKVIRKTERDQLMEISTILGFDKKFCKDAIDEILDNEYILEEPPVFSDKEIAKAFIKDGFRLAFSDKELHLYELKWLNSVLETNKIEKGYGMAEFERLKNLPLKKEETKTEYEISGLINQMTN